MPEEFWFGTVGKKRLGKRWEDIINIHIKETMGT